MRQLLQHAYLCLEAVYLLHCLLSCLGGDFHDLQGVFLAVELVYAPVHLTVSAAADQLLPLVDAIKGQHGLLATSHLFRINHPTTHKII
jgi:hypothetical protein